MEEKNNGIGNIDERSLELRSTFTENISPSRLPLLGSGNGSFQVWNKPYLMNFLDGTYDEGTSKERNAPPPSDFKIPISSNGGDDSARGVDLDINGPVEIEKLTGHDNKEDKKNKRIISNRESAQRCRRRKVQYVERMQQKVRELEAQIAVLSPQLSHYQSQNKLLQLEQESLSAQISLYETNEVLQDAAIADKKAEVNRLRQLHRELQELYLHAHGVVVKYLEPDEFELSAADLGLNQYELQQFVFPNSNLEYEDIYSGTTTEGNGLNQFININMSTEEQQQGEYSHGEALSMAKADHGDKQALQIPIWATPKSEPHTKPNWTSDEADV